MVLLFSPNIRRHSTRKRASVEGIRDLQLGPKRALGNTTDPQPLPAAAASSSSKAVSIPIATTSTPPPTHAPSLPNLASSASSANHVAPTTQAAPPTTAAAATSATPAPAKATPASVTSVVSVASVSPSFSSVPKSTVVFVPGAPGSYTVPAVTSYISPTVLTTTSSVSTTSPSTTATSKSFLANTGAAAAIFTAAGLIGLALLVIVVSFLIKRRRRSQEQSDDNEYFEKMVAPHAYDNSGVAGSRGLASLDPVPLPKTIPRPSDRYNTRGNNNGYTAQNPGLEYPPGTSYTSQVQSNAYNTASGSQAASDFVDDPFGAGRPGRAAPAHANPSSDSFY